MPQLHSQRAISTEILCEENLDHEKDGRMYHEGCQRVYIRKCMISDLLCAFKCVLMNGDELRLSYYD